MGGGGKLCPHPEHELRHLTGESYRQVGEPFRVTWYSFLNIPAGGPDLRGHGVQSFQRVASVTLMAGNRRAEPHWRGRAWCLAPTRSGSSQPPFSSTSGPRPAPSRPLPPRGRGVGRRSCLGRGPGEPRGVSVCVTYVTGRPATETPTTARSPAKGGRAPAPPPNPIGKGQGREELTFRPRPLALRVARLLHPAKVHVRLRGNVIVTEATEGL